MKTKSLLSKVLVPLTALSLFAAACDNKEEVREAPPVVEKASLSLDGFTVESLANTPAEKICEAFEGFVEDFQKNHLPGVEVTFLNNSSKTACSQEVARDRIDTELRFNLKNSETSVNLLASFHMSFDENQNFVSSGAYVGRIENENSTGSSELKSPDKLIGENIDYLKKTIELWAAPSRKKLSLLGLTFDEAVAAINKHYAVGNKNILIEEPVLRVEFIPSVENPSTGSVNFLEIGAGNFQERRTRSGTEKTFLLCADIACLNAGVTYQIIANRIVFTSRNVPLNERSTAHKTTKQTFVIESSDLD
jgi:hypothetical protein